MEFAAGFVATVVIYVLFYIYGLWLSIEKQSSWSVGRGFGKDYHTIILVSFIDEP